MMKITRKTTHQIDLGDTIIEVARRDNGAARVEVIGEGETTTIDLSVQAAHALSRLLIGEGVSVTDPSTSHLEPDKTAADARRKAVKDFVGRQPMTVTSLLPLEIANGSLTPALMRGVSRPCVVVGWAMKGRRGWRKDSVQARTTTPKGQTTRTHTVYVRVHLATPSVESIEARLEGARS